MLDGRLVPNLHATMSGNKRRREPAENGFFKITSHSGDRSSNANQAKEKHE